MPYIVKKNLAILILITCVSCSGDCGIFLIKYAEYLMHDHPFTVPTLIGLERKWQLNCSTSKFYPCSGFHFDYVKDLYDVEC